MPEQPENHSPKPTGPPPSVKCATGTPVRVKRGTAVPGFEDIPLGGWSATIIDVDQGSNPPGYLVKWDQRTLAAMPSDYRQRCERDGLELDSVWLDEKNIEPAYGEVLPVEQPAQLVPRPLNMDGQDNPLRTILGLTGNDPLPTVAASSEIKYVRIFSFSSQVLFSPDQVPAAPKSILTTLVTTCSMGAFCGVVLGAAVAALDGAAIAAKIVPILLGSGGCLLGAGYGFLFGAVNRIRRGPWLGAVVGTTVAGMVGGMLGVMLMAFLGTGRTGNWLGRCVYSTKTILIADHYAANNDEGEVMDTLLHEIAHALTPGHGHGKVWNTCARRLGATPRACCEKPVVVRPGKYQATCPSCGKTFHRYRKPRYKCYSEEVTPYYCNRPGCGKERGWLVFYLHADSEAK